MLVGTRCVIIHNSNNPAKQATRRKESLRMSTDEKWLKEIPSHIGWYLAGFADGEGSFNVSLRKKDYSIGWQICPSFNVSQRDRVILALFKRWFGCGTLRERSDGVVYYEVTNIRSLHQKVVPFFRKFKFLSFSKKRNFRIFRSIIDIMVERKHLEEEGLKQILALREKLNEGRGRKRKYNQDDVLNKNDYPQRLYAGPRRGGEDIVRTLW